jgi:hypothetical protein
MGHRRRSEFGGCRSKTEVQNNNERPCPKKFLTQPTEFEESGVLQQPLASFRRETPILQKTLLAQQRFQGVSEPRLIFNGVAQAIVVAGSGIECGRAPLM